METWHWLPIAFGLTILVYAGILLWLIAVGRRADARALGGFIPDCVVFVRRLLADGRVSRGRKLLLVALLGYLLSPIDLIPDFIPIAGQLDDAIVVALVIRTVVRGGGPDVLDDHWPGPASTRDLVRRLAFGGADGSRSK